MLPAQSLAPLSIAPSLDKYFTELAVGAKKQETFSDFLLGGAAGGRLVFSFESSGQGGPMMK